MRFSTKSKWEIWLMMIFFDGLFNLFFGSIPGVGAGMFIIFVLVYETIILEIEQKNKAQVTQ